MKPGQGRHIPNVLSRNLFAWFKVDPLEVGGHQLKRHAWRYDLQNWVIPWRRRSNCVSGYFKSSVDLSTNTARCCSSSVSPTHCLSFASASTSARPLARLAVRVSPKLDVRRAWHARKYGRNTWHDSARPHLLNFFASTRSCECIKRGIGSHCSRGGGVAFDGAHAPHCACKPLSTVND